VEKIGQVKIKGIIRNAPFIAGMIASCIVIAYSSRTMARNEEWIDTAAITKSIIAVSPMNPWAYNSLAAEYIAQGKNFIRRSAIFRL